MLRHLIVLLAALLSPLVAHAGNGGQDLGGGNAYEAEFRLIGLQLVSDVGKSQLRDAEVGFSLSDLALAVKQVQVFGTDTPPTRMRVNGKDRHAVNSLGNQVIVFNNTVWSLLNEEQKRLFVLHEYLRFAQGPDGRWIDDAARYEYSTRVIYLLRQRQPTPKSGMRGKSGVAAMRMYFGKSFSGISKGKKLPEINEDLGNVIQLGKEELPKRQAALAKSRLPRTKEARALQAEIRELEANLREAEAKNDINEGRLGNRLPNDWDAVGDRAALAAALLHLIERQDELLALASR